MFTAIVTDRPLFLSLAAIVALVLAEAAHRWIETPYRLDQRITGRRALRFTAVCVLLPLMVGLASARLTTRFPVPGIDQARRQHSLYTDGCTRREPHGSTAVCRVDLPEADRSIFLIGDSHAGQWSEPASTAAHRWNADLTIIEAGSCPVVPGLVREAGGEVSQYCLDTIETAFDLIQAERPDVVIVGFASTTYVTDGDVGLSFDDGPREESVSGRAALWERAVRRTVTELRELGVGAAIVIHDNPSTDLPPDRCGWLRYGFSGCRSSVDRVVVDAGRAPAFDAERAAIEGIDGAFAIDPTPVLCSEKCSNHHGGQWMYRDSTHVSVLAAEKLTPLFVDAIERALAFADWT